MILAYLKLVCYIMMFYNALKKCQTIEVKHIALYLSETILLFLYHYMIYIHNNRCISKKLFVYSAASVVKQDVNIL